MVRPPVDLADDPLGEPQLLLAATGHGGRVEKLVNIRVRRTCLRFAHLLTVAWTVRCSDHPLGVSSRDPGFGE